MILENKKSAFEIGFDGKNFSIPEGKFEVAENLGRHILAVADKWEGAEVVLVSSAPKEAIVAEVKAEAPVEEPVSDELPEDLPEEEPETAEEV